MNGYITKYALTKGIIETELTPCESGGGGMVQAPRLGAHAYFHGEGRDWHTTKESAVKRANLMRDNKIRKMKTQITKLQAMNFI